MLLTIFSGNRSNGSGEEEIFIRFFNLYGHGGHLGGHHHVIKF